MVAQPFFEDSAARGATLAKTILETVSVQQTVHWAHDPHSHGPHVHHATASRVVKGEDVMLVHPLGIQCQPQSLMYMVCDGHSGVDAAAFVAENFLRFLNPKLPSKLPDWRNTAEVESFSSSVRKAICETFVRLDNEWSTRAHFAGTTVTVALATGWLLTVANTGDSGAVLDTGTSMLELIKSHRIHSNLEEQARLKSAGQTLAPLGFHLQGPSKPGEQGVGPLRLWPGGLCVSRSVGDLDAGPEVVPVPHIRQVMLPRAGSRVIMASDGLWDVLSYTKALKLTRSKPTSAAASALITAVSRDLRTLDDASIIVIDLLPTESTSFPTVALKSGSGDKPAAAAPARKKPSSGGLFSCFWPEVDETDGREVPVGDHGHVTFYSDTDCLVAYPGLRQLLARTAMNGQVFAMNAAPHTKGPVDYTLHGAGSFGPRTITRNLDNFSTHAGTATVTGGMLMQRSGSIEAQESTVHSAGDAEPGSQSLYRC